MSFNFSIATKDAVPDMFYLVVEEYALGPVFRVTSIISWFEKASIYDCSEYFTSSPILIVEESKDFTRAREFLSLETEPLHYPTLSPKTLLWTLMKQ